MVDPPRDVGELVEMVDEGLVGAGVPLSLVDDEVGFETGGTFAFLRGAKPEHVLY